MSPSAGLGRALLILAPLCAAGLAAFFGVFRARQQLGDLHRTARWVGDRVPALSHDVLSAVQLQEALRGKPDFSVDLARAFLTRMDDTAAQVDPRPLADRRPLQRALLLLTA